MLKILLINVLFLEKNESFCFKNLSNLTNKFYDNFRKTFCLILLIKIVTQKPSVIFDTFSRQNGIFIFPPKGGVLLN